MLARRFVRGAHDLRPRNFGDQVGPYFMASLTARGHRVPAGDPRVFCKAPKLPLRRPVAIGLAPFLAAVWNIQFLRLPAVSSTTYLSGRLGWPPAEARATAAILLSPVILLLRSCILSESVT